jgi:hypothetical protein
MRGVLIAEISCGNLGRGSFDNNSYPAYISDFLLKNYMAYIKKGNLYPISNQYYITIAM